MLREGVDYRRASCRSDFFAAGYTKLPSKKYGCVGACNGILLLQCDERSDGPTNCNYSNSLMWGAISERDGREVVKEGPQMILIRWTSSLQSFASPKSRRWTGTDGTLAGHTSRHPRRRWSRRTGQSDQVVVSDKHVYGDCAHGPLVSVRREGGPELRGGIRAVIRRLTS